MSFTRTPESLRRLKLAYETLHISADVITTQPPITSQLRMIAERLRKRRLPISPYYYLKCAPGDSPRRIVSLYYSLPRDQRNLVPIEAYCLAVEANPLDILEIIVHSIASVSRLSSAAIAHANHPAVVEKTVEMALEDDGIEDRNTLHKAVGFLPTPKGSQITVNASANSAVQSATILSLPAPPPEATIRRLVDRFNDAQPRALAAAPPADLPERMPYEDAIPVAAESDPDDDDS
jgi:hypothetical protein